MDTSSSGSIKLTENNFQLVSFQIWPLTPVDMLLKRLCITIAYNKEKDETRYLPES